MASMTEPVLIQRPQRWDAPFGPNMSEVQVQGVLQLEPFCNMDPDKFSRATPLADIIRNDTRIRNYRNGDIIVRADDYGDSAFIVIEGIVRVVTRPGLSERLLGRTTTKKKGFFEVLRQLWSNPRDPEVRDPTRYGARRETGSRQHGTDETHVFLQDVPAVLEHHRTVRLGAGEMFGEIAALGRTPRTATVFADGDVELLELRWQGLRDIRRRDDEFRQHVDHLYRERGQKEYLRSTPLFRGLGASDLAKIADETLFETYGDFDWHTKYKKLAEASAAERLAEEPVIAQEGSYPDGVLLIRSGFARVSVRVGNGHRTISYLGRGQAFGFEEIAHNWRFDETVPYQRTLRAVGYVDVLRVPTSIMEEYVLPNMPPDQLPPPIEARGAAGSVADVSDEASGIKPGMLEFLVENRYINGTATMLINLDRCVRCDDCVKACAATHGGNPRFNRHGRRYGRYMVANACMHCVDPVCMIGCPTGAIHRSSLGGPVVINDDTCIGCATCANSCPYDNIRMVEIRNDRGAFILDEDTNRPIVKATKCDLCIDQMGGPACQRACPHDALERVDMRDLPALADWLNRE